MSARETGCRPQAGLPIAFACLVVAAAICAAYWTSFGGALVFDDGPAISENPTIRGLWPLSVPLSPPAGTTVGGRPVANLSFAVNFALTGNLLSGYHACNLFIHVLNAFLIFGIVRRTLLRVGGSGRSARDSLPIALAVALIWGVHPMATEAVTYLVQRVESLMALFVLLSLYGFIRAIDGGRQAAWLSVSSVSCLLGAGTKEVAAVAPALILLYDAQFVSGSLRGALRTRKSYYLSLTAGWLLIVALGFASGWNRAGSAGFGQEVPAGAYWITQAQALCRYLRLAFWPNPLVFDYGTYLTPGIVDDLPAILVLAVLVASTVATLLRRNPLGFAGAWFFLLLLPTTIVPVVTQTIAEHRAYLSLAAVVLCMVLAVHRLAGGGWKAWVPLTVLALVFGALTEKRNSVYGSNVSLWSATVRDWPQNARAHCSLGLALSRLPDGLARAISEYREAIRLHDNYADAHTDLGVALEQTPGNRDAAIGEYERAIQIRPGSADTHNDLGLALGKEGRTAEARLELEKAISIRPGFADAECNLGILLLSAGEESAAENHLEKAVELAPSDARARFYLAGVFAGKGRMDEAGRMLHEVIQLRPDFAEAHSTLGMLLFRSGNASGGMAEIDKAIELEPNLAQAHLLRAAALLQLGRLAEGRQELQLVLKLQPSNPAAAQMLGALYGSR